MMKRRIKYVLLDISKEPVVSLSNPRGCLYPAEYKHVYYQHVTPTFISLFPSDMWMAKCEPLFTSYRDWLQNSFYSTTINHIYKGDGRDFNVLVSW